MEWDFGFSDKAEMQAALGCVSIFLSQEKMRQGELWIATRISSILAGGWCCFVDVFVISTVLACGVITPKGDVAVHI
jgi:hypothetical protein